MKKSWYTIRAAAAAPDTVDATIYDEIGYWGVTGASFISDLKAQVGPATKSINLSINSPGGSVFDGWAIFNALKATKLPINVTVMGIAASMASVIAMAGTTIKMPENSMMMVHNAISGVYGDAEEMRAVAKVLDDIDASIVSTYMARTGKDEAAVRALMTADTYMTAAEALGHGFATEVIPTVEASATFDTAALPANVRALFEAKRTPEPAPPAAPSATLTDLISAEAKAAGMDEFTADWVTDPAITNVEQARALITEAKEIKALCAMVGRPADATPHITARLPLAGVRAALAKARADESDATNVDTTRNSGSTKGKPNASADVNPSNVWAKVTAMNVAISDRSK